MRMRVGACVCASSTRQNGNVCTLHYEQTLLGGVGGDGERAIARRQRLIVATFRRAPMCAVPQRTACDGYYAPDQTHPQPAQNERLLRQTASCALHIFTVRGVIHTRTLSVPHRSADTTHTIPDDMERGLCARTPPRCTTSTSRGESGAATSALTRRRVSVIEKLSDLSGLDSN